MIIEYKEFLTEGNVFRPNIIASREHEDLQGSETQQLWTAAIVQTAEVYRKIDTLIFGLVTGILTPEKYNAAKEGILYGITQKVDSGPSPHAAGAHSDAAGAKAMKVREAAGLIAIPIVTILNTATVDAIKPISTHVTAIYFNGGASTYVHEPVMEVVWKVRATLTGIMTAQQRQSQSGLALPHPGVRM